MIRTLFDIADVFIVTVESIKGGDENQIKLVLTFG